MTEPRTSPRWFKRQWRAGRLHMGRRSLRQVARDYAGASRQRTDLADLKAAARAWLTRKRRH